MRAGLVVGVVIVAGASVFVSCAIPDPAESIRAAAELEAERNQTTLALIDTMQMLLAMFSILAAGVLGVGLYLIRESIRGGAAVPSGPSFSIGKIEKMEIIDNPVASGTGADIRMIPDDRYHLLPIEGSYYNG